MYTKISFRTTTATALSAKGGDPRPHADYVDPADVPLCWLGRAMTVDIEAKAKELAVVPVD